jgi:hypothetical protein
MARRKKRSESDSAETQGDERPEGDAHKPPITYGEVTKENPSGIESVSDTHAQHLGTLVGNGGPGAAGATVAGPVIHVATEGGTVPLPVKDHPEDVETSASADHNNDTSQAAALESGAAPEQMPTEHNQEPGSEEAAA